MKEILSKVVASTVVCAAFYGVAFAESPRSTIGLEARVGQGISVGGGAGQAAWRLSPTTVSAIAEIAIREQPWTTAYGGIVWEGGRRASVGGTLGIRVLPFGAGLRLGGGALVILAPNTALGMTASVGRCWGEDVKFCSDIEGAVFPWGTDVPEDRVAGQIQIVMGVAFEAD